MILAQEAPASPVAVIDGVGVDAVAAAAAACPGVAALDGGTSGEAVTYLPGRTVAGVVVGNGRVTVQVRARWGVPALDVAAQITTALAPLTGPRPVDVVIADVDDPPAPPPVSAPAGALRPNPGLPPA
jgi:hypothetical protein